MVEKIKKTDEEWQAQLTPEQFDVARRHGTEPAFNNKYWDCKEKGKYVCVCCGNELFTSETKFNSGCGWPSFYEAMKEGSVAESVDRSYNMVRTEITCSRCGGHLGHVFNDGPRPTGLRYCINSVALDFKEKD